MKCPTRYRRMLLVGESRVALSIVLGLFLSSSAEAQVSQHGTVGVDLVTLKSGRALRGSIFKTDPSGAITLIVTREWLQTSQPELFHKAVHKETETRKTAIEQLRERLKKWLETAPKEPRLEFFLKQELERIEKVPAEGEVVEPEQFIWLNLRHETISKVNRAPADRKHIAMWAWSERLSKVETRDTHDLERELKKLGIDIKQPTPDLSDRLPPQVQDDPEWEARKAIVEYAFVKPLDFQGTGDVLIRTDVKPNAADLAPVLKQALESQVGTLLKDLTGTGLPSTAAKSRDWLATASREADGLSLRGLRATRVEVKLDGNQAVVETAFAVRLPQGKWETIWSHREIQDATKVRADLEDRIAADPQVKKVLETAKSFGLSADEQIRQAIRFGAATMVAQQNADSKFFEFRDRYLKRLDSPPLSLSR